MTKYSLIITNICCIYIYIHTLHLIIKQPFLLFEQNLYNLYTILDENIYKEFSIMFYLPQLFMVFHKWIWFSIVLMVNIIMAGIKLSWASAVVIHTCLFNRTWTDGILLSFFFHYYFIFFFAKWLNLKQKKYILYI